jgi:hypothetical protein
MLHALVSAPVPVIDNGAGIIPVPGPSIKRVAGAAPPHAADTRAGELTPT